MLFSIRNAAVWALALNLSSVCQATPVSLDDNHGSKIPLPIDDDLSTKSRHASRDDHHLAGDNHATHADQHATRAAAWEARHRMTSASYQDTFDELVADEYRLTYVSGYTINNDPRFAALWEKTNDGVAWVARHGMTSSSYQSQFDDLVDQGYRLRQVNGYTVGGSARFAAIWDKSSGPAWEARHGLTASELQETFDDLVDQGYRLTHVSGYAQGNTALYAALWEKIEDGIAWMARSGMTAEGYQSRFDEYVSQGYRLVVVNGYVVDNVAYYAAIWDKSSGGAWVARHGLSSSQYQTKFDELVGEGYRLKSVSGYTLNGDQDRYAAIWEKV